MKHPTATLRLWDGTVVNRVLIIKESKFRYLIEHTEWLEHTVTGAIRNKRTVHKWYWKSQVTPHDGES